VARTGLIPADALLRARVAVAHTVALDIHPGEQSVV